LVATARPTLTDLPVSSIVSTEEITRIVKSRSKTLLRSKDLSVKKVQVGKLSYFYQVTKLISEDRSNSLTLKNCDMKKNVQVPKSAVSTTDQNLALTDNH